MRKNTFSRQDAKYITDNVLHLLSPLDPVVVGAYRRETENISKISVLVKMKLDRLEQKYQNIINGKCVINGIPFNFHSYDDENKGAKMLTYTGSQMFYALLAGSAKKQGMKLNKYGLWLNGYRVAGKSEKQIFNCLGVRYYSATERNFFGKGKYYLEEI